MKVIIDLTSIREDDNDRIGEALDKLYKCNTNDIEQLNNLIDVERWLVCYLNQTNYYTMTREV